MPLFSTHKNKTQFLDIYHVFKLNDEGISFMKWFGYDGIDVKNIVIVLFTLLTAIGTIKALFYN